MNVLLDHGAGVSIENGLKETPLTLAISKRRPKVIKILLEHGANIDLSVPRDNSPLMVAVNRLSYSAVNSLLDRGANINQVSEHDDLASGLHICARYGFVRMAMLLLDRGANVNLSSSKGLTPLAIAAWRQKLDLFSLFIDRGADVFIRDQKGRTILERTRRQRRKYEMEDHPALVEVYDRMILRLKEAEKAWQQEHGIVIDRDATSGSDSGAEDSEGG